MKLTKKILAFLMAGVLAVGILTACSGSAGPLTKDNVADYMLDMAKVSGYDLRLDSGMAETAQKAVTYLNEKASSDAYKNMDVAKAIQKIMRNDDGSLAKAIGAESGYYYGLSFAVVESYRTDLFNQGQTAIVAAALMSEPTNIKMPETAKAQSDEEEDEDEVEARTVWFNVAEGTINGKKCMVAVLRTVDDGSFNGGHGGSSSSTASSSASSEGTAASSAASSDATASME